MFWDRTSSKPQGNFTIKTYFRLIVSAFAGLLIWPGFSNAQQVQPTAPAVQTQPQAEHNTSLEEQGRAMLYRHPKLNYLIGVPPGNIVEHRDAVNGIAMKSRKGYMITLQTGPAKPGTPLPELMARLEQRYLGEGRPWTYKLGEQSTRLAGLEAFESLYEGAGSRVRVIVTRDARVDYAFIFIAPPQEFDRLVSDFNWVLQSFRPASAVAATPGSGRETDGLVEMIQGRVRNFSSSGFGFAIDYPASWQVEQSGGPFIVISGKKDTPAYFATINIQNVQPSQDVANITKATEAVVSDLRNQIESVDKNARFFGQDAFQYRKPGLTLHGIQFTVAYEREGRMFRQWSVVLPRPDNGIVHVWSYAAPEDRFDRFGAIASNMLQSWRIIAQNW